MLPRQQGTRMGSPNRSSCPYRFLSYNSACDSPLGLWNAAGSNQAFTLVAASNTTFYLKLGCGKYLSVAGPCGNTVLDTWPSAGINQQFRFVPTATEGFPSFHHHLRVC